VLNLNSVPSLITVNTGQMIKIDPTHCDAQDQQRDGADY
jgi:hypothetical protein